MPTQGVNWLKTLYPGLPAIPTVGQPASGHDTVRCSCHPAYAHCSGVWGQTLQRMEHKVMVFKCDLLSEHLLMDKRTQEGSIVKGQCCYNLQALLNVGNLLKKCLKVSKDSFTAWPFTHAMSIERMCVLGKFFQRAVATHNQAQCPHTARVISTRKCG